MIDIAIHHASSSYCEITEAKSGVVQKARSTCNRATDSSMFHENARSRVDVLCRSRAQYALNAFVASSDLACFCFPRLTRTCEVVKVMASELSQAFVGDYGGVLRNLRHSTILSHRFLIEMTRWTKRWQFAHNSAMSASLVILSMALDSGNVWWASKLASSKAKSAAVEKPPHKSQASLPTLRRDANNRLLTCGLHSRLLCSRVNRPPSVNSSSSKLSRT